MFEWCKKCFKAVGECYDAVKEKVVKFGEELVQEGKKIVELVKEHAPAVIDSLPGVGHLKGLCHQIMGDHDRAQLSYLRANRGTIYAASGALLMVATPFALVGGVAVGAAAGVAIAVGQVVSEEIIGAGKSTLKKISGLIPDGISPEGLNVRPLGGLGNLIPGIPDVGKIPELPRNVGKILDFPGGGTPSPVRLLGPVLAQPQEIYDGSLTDNPPPSQDLIDSKPDDHNKTIKDHDGFKEKVCYNKKNDTFVKIFYDMKNSPKERNEAIEIILQNYKRAALMSIGPNVKICTVTNPDYYPKVLISEGGYSLKVALEKGVITPQHAIKQAKQLHEKLKSHKIAHCDVKPDNVIVTKPAGNIPGQLRLIDTGTLVDFGEERPVCTRGNITTPLREIGLGICGPNTDTKGFQQVIDAVIDFTRSHLKASTSTLLRKLGVNNLGQASKLSKDISSAAKSTEPGN